MGGGSCVFYFSVFYESSIKSMHVKSIIFTWKEINVIFIVVVLDPRTSPICAEPRGPAGVFQVSEPEAHGRSLIRMERGQIPVCPKPVCARASWRSAPRMRRSLPMFVGAPGPALGNGGKGPQTLQGTDRLPRGVHTHSTHALSSELRVWGRPGVCTGSEGVLCDRTFWNDGNVLDLP